MRIFAVLALIPLVFGLASPKSSAETRRGGAGDWPLFCSIPGGESYDGFLLRSDGDSPSGYALYFYSGGYPQAAVYPDVQDTDDGEFLQVYGAETYGLFGRLTHHMLAYVAKDLTHKSEAGMKNTLSVFNPTFYRSDLAPSNCAAQPE